MNTKSVQLTEDEVKTVIQYHARQIAQSADDYDNYIERMRYLSKRLADFKEPKKEKDNQW